MHPRCFIFIVILLCTIHKGTSIMCYVCTTLLNEECGEEFEPDEIEKTECDNDDDVCMIHKMPEMLHYPEVITRNCAESTFCHIPDEVLEHCITCDRDLCNSSMFNRPYCTVLLILLPAQYIL